MAWSEWIVPDLVQSPEHPAWTKHIIELQAEIAPYSSEPFDVTDWLARMTTLWSGMREGIEDSATETSRLYAPPSRATPNLQGKFHVYSLNYTDRPDTFALDTKGGGIIVTYGWLVLHWTEWPDYRATPPNLPPDARVIPGREGVYDWSRYVEFEDAPTASVRWSTPNIGSLLGDHVTSTVNAPVDGTEGRATWGDPSFGGPIGMPGVMDTRATVPSLAYPDDGFDGIETPPAPAGQDVTLRFDSSHLYDPNYNLTIPSQWDSHEFYVRGWRMDAGAAWIDLRMPRFRYWMPDRDIPLRQRQRDDGLGLSTARWRRGRSRQASNRWAGYL